MDLRFRFVPWFLGRLPFLLFRLLRVGSRHCWFYGGPGFISVIIVFITGRWRMIAWAVLFLFASFVLVILIPGSRLRLRLSFACAVLVQVGTFCDRSRGP